MGRLFLLQRGFCGVDRGFNFQQGADLFSQGFMAFSMRAP